MLAAAPDSRSVMPQLRDFIADSVLIAHNASFDRGFLDAEYQRLGYPGSKPFICSMRVARRLYPHAPNHRLGTLVNYARLPQCGEFHRALADAEMTGYLWLHMQQQLRQQYRIENATLGLMRKLQSIKISLAADYLRGIEAQD